MSKFDELVTVYSDGRAYEHECVAKIESGTGSVLEYIAWPAQGPDATGPASPGVASYEFLPLKDLTEIERTAAADERFAINNHGSVRGTLRLQLDANDAQSMFDMPVTMFRSEKGWVMSLGSSAREVLTPEGKLPPATLEAAFDYVKDLVAKRFQNPSPPEKAKG
jgi:hypothetical protein